MKHKTMSFMYYVDLAIGKWYKKVWEALGKRDLKTVRETAFKMAFNKHVELLKENMPGALYGERVQGLDSLQRDFMQGLNLLHAAALARIFEEIREGEEHYYLNLKITKRKGEIEIENVGWDWLKEGEKGEALGGRCLCGYRFKAGDVRCYPHSGGVDVDGFEGRQWVYFHCPRCGYDMALPKILNQIIEYWNRGQPYLRKLRIEPYPSPVEEKARILRLPNPPEKVEGREKLLPESGWFKHRFALVEKESGIVEAWDGVKGVVFGRFSSWEDAEKEVMEWVRLHEKLRKLC